MRTLIQFLVHVRVLCGLGAGIAFFVQNFLLGSVLFTCGLLMKLVDVPLADWLKAPIPADDEDYRRGAILFNSNAFFGLLSSLTVLARAGEVPWIYPVLLLALPAAAMSVSLFGKWVSWVRPHSLFAKVRSGLISLPIAIFPVAVHYSTTMAVLVAVSGALILAETSHKAWYYSHRQPA